MHCNQCPFLYQVSRAKRSFAFISGSASLSNSKRAVMEMVGSPALAPLETHQKRKAGCHLKVDDTRLFIGYRICAQNSSKVLVLSNSRVRDVELNNSTILSKAGLKNFISASVMPIIRTKCTVFFFH